MSSVSRDYEGDHTGTYPRYVSPDAMRTEAEQVLAALETGATPFAPVADPVQAAVTETVTSRPPEEYNPAGLAMARTALANARSLQP